jgi:hypothetical protein
MMFGGDGPERNDRVLRSLVKKRDIIAAQYWRLRHAAGWELADPLVALREGRNDYGTGVPHSLLTHRPRCPHCGNDATLVSGGGRGKRYRCEGCSGRFAVYYIDPSSHERAYYRRYDTQEESA